jgi:hypothetical protein
MWSFSENKKKIQEPPRIRALIDDRGLLDLSDNSAVLRLWLPEAGRIALNQTTKNSGIVGAKYLRDFFVSYLYGAHELLRMQVMNEGLYYVPLPIQETYHRGKTCNNTIMFSRAPSVEYIPGLGKNIFPFKVFLPQRIKDDLQGLADNLGIPLSQFVREILISHFFGQTFWPAKLQSWSQENERIGKEWAQEERESISIPYENNRPDEIDGDRVVEWL